MHDFLSDLSRTFGIAAVVVNINIANRTATNWAKERRNDRHFSTISPLLDHRYDIGDHFSTSLHPNEISAFDLLILNKIKIMKTDS